MCFGSAIAQDLTWETGEPLAAIPLEGNVEIQIIKGVPRKVYNITHTPTVRALLQSLYGHKKLKGPALQGWHLAEHLQGEPSPSSYREVIDELRTAGPTSRGLVFIEQPPTTENPYGTGHIVNVRNVGNRVIFRDASNANMDWEEFVQRAKHISFYRTN